VPRPQVGDWQTRSFWLEHRSYQPNRPLSGDEIADVVIVGGGFTGLWTAIVLKEAEPDLDVVVLEQKVVGYGASGRNGGFAMTMVGRSIYDLLRKVGRERARATHLAMRDTLKEIYDFCRAEGIEADVTNPGVLTVSNGPEQDIRIRQDLEAAERLGLDDFHPLSASECRELVDSERIRMGHFEDDSLLVDPAALVRGLRDAAMRRGVRVYEHTPVDQVVDIDERRVEARTPFGTVHADRALLATNAYAVAHPVLRRFLFTVYAYIILTEPLTDEQWKRVGWERRMGIEDKRIMPHFHRPTADGRILWGGRDASIIDGPPNPRYDRDPYIFKRLEETFRWTFPQLHDVAIAKAWAGPVCGTVQCFASIGFLGKSERIAYALGYAGHGVGPSRLAAKIVRDLLLGTKSELLELPMVTSRPIPLPPGPLRPVALGITRRLQRELQRADDEGTDRGALVRLALKVLQ
jgi:glycine/D-amino acid oxidase-like deaminating enzyme